MDVSEPPVTRSTIPAIQGKQKVATRPSLPRKCRRSSLPPCESNQERGSASVEIDQAQESRCQMAKLMPVDVEPEMMEKKKVEQQQKDMLEDVVDVSVSVSPVSPQSRFVFRWDGSDDTGRYVEKSKVGNFGAVIDQLQRSRGETKS